MAEMKKEDFSILAAKVAGVVLAAGKGTRMASALPKVLHPVGNKPMLSRVLDCLKATGICDIALVLGAERGAFSSFLEANSGISLCVQDVANGTAGALASCAGFFAQAPISYAQTKHPSCVPTSCPYLLVCAGDTPALRADILREFILSSLATESVLSVLGIEIDNPSGYGRIKLDAEGCISEIIEEKDANESDKAITLCNSGVIFARAEFIFELLRKVNARNSQGEYYLTDCVGLAYNLSVNAKQKPKVFISQDWRSFLGVNDQAQLAEMNRYFSCNPASQEYVCVE